MLLYGHPGQNGTIQCMKTPAISVKSKVHPVGFPPVSNTLPGAIQRIVSELKPEKIILFGSYAYGNPTPDSDVDLLVIMKTRAKEIDGTLRSRICSIRASFLWIFS